MKCPSISVYGEPVQVETYATHLATQLGRMEEWTRQPDADIAQAVVSGVVKPAASDNLADRLWKPETWKKQSALGTFKVRSSAIRDIDHALEAYHARLEGPVRRAVCGAGHVVPGRRQAPAGQSRERAFGRRAAARRADPGHHAQSRTDLVSRGLRYVSVTDSVQVSPAGTVTTFAACTVLPPIVPLTVIS